MDDNGKPKPDVIANCLIITLGYEFGEDDEYAASGYYTVTDSNGDPVKSGDFNTNGYGRFDFHGWRIPEGRARPNPATNP
jgi:hypothetical protein